MSIRAIEELQKRHAEEECRLWLKQLETLQNWQNIDANACKTILGILSCTSKAVRRHGYFVGMDSEEKKNEV